MQLNHLTVTLLAISLLAGCGGGGSTGSATPQTNNGVSSAITKIEASVDYRQGVTMSTAFYETNLVVNTLGTLPPHVIGLPTGSNPHFSATGLPAGMSIDANSGIISGTPTAVNGGTVNVIMTVAGFTGSVGTQFTLYVNAPMPAPLAWTAQTMHAGFSALSQHSAAMLGNTIYVVGSRTDNQTIETWRSTDKGLTWQKLPVAPGVAVANFALSSDGTALYLAGGVNAAKLGSNQIWRFDGTIWAQVAVKTPFSARWGHTLTKLGNKWIIVGGAAFDASNNAVSNLGDVWESSDNGVNWVNTVPKSQANSSLLRTGHCATVLNGKLYVLGGVALGSEWSDSTDLIRPMISVSPDGATWSNILMGRAFSVYAYASCVSYNGKIVLAGGASVNASGIAIMGRGNVKVATFSNLDSLPNSSIAQIDFDPQQGIKPLPYSAAYRYSNGMVVLGTDFFIIGGQSFIGGGTLDDAWSSSL